MLSSIQHISGPFGLIAVAIVIAASLYRIEIKRRERVEGLTRDQQFHLERAHMRGRLIQFVLLVVLIGCAIGAAVVLAGRS
jgi:hypothetical protein